MVTFLRTQDVLQDVDADKLPEHPEGWLLVLCADGHRFRDKFAFHLETCGHGPCHHPLTPLGGVLRLGSTDLARTQRGYPADEVLLDDIDASLALKGLRNIAAYTHFPCGAAGNAKLTPIEQFAVFEKGVLRLRSRFPHVRVVPFCHAHYADDRYRTYMVDFTATKK